MKCECKFKITSTAFCRLTVLNSRLHHQQNYFAGNESWELIKGANEFKADYLHGFHLEKMLSGNFLVATPFADANTGTFTTKA